MFQLEVAVRYHEQEFRHSISAGPPYVLCVCLGHISVHFPFCWAEFKRRRWLQLALLRQLCERFQCVFPLWHLCWANTDRWCATCSVCGINQPATLGVNKQGTASVAKAKSALSSRLLLCHMRRKPTPAQFSVCATFTFCSDPNTHSRKMDEAGPCCTRFTWLVLRVS